MVKISFDLIVKPKSKVPKSKVPKSRPKGLGLTLNTKITWVWMSVDYMTL